jgi:hypothetical protein
MFRIPLPEPAMPADRRASRLRLALAAALALALAPPAPAHEGRRHEGGIGSAAQPTVAAAFDIVHARITTDGRVARFHMAVSGQAGAIRPTPSGRLAGSEVYAYVWPTTIDPYAVGFEAGAGLLALVVASHPDFDDSPLFDENGDGDPDNDGEVWHAHWAVLAPTPGCGEGALGVLDIPDGATPRLPKTWPGLPLLLDSPGWQPRFAGDSVEVRVAFDDIGSVDSARFDGVTAGLRINANVHAPLLCVENVFKTASGDLGLPGRVDR